MYVYIHTHMHTCMHACMHACIHAKYGSDAEPPATRKQLTRDTQRATLQYHFWYPSEP